MLEIVEGRAHAANNFFKLVTHMEKRLCDEHIRFGMVTQSCLSSTAESRHIVLTDDEPFLRFKFKRNRE